MAILPVSQSLFGLLKRYGEGMRLRMEVSRGDITHHAVEGHMLGISDGEVSEPELVPVAFGVEKRDEIDVEMPVDVLLLALLGDQRTAMIQFTWINRRLRERETPAGEQRVEMKLIARADHRMVTVGVDGKANGERCDGVRRWIRFDNATSG